MSDVHFADGFDTPDRLAFGLPAPQLAVVAGALAIAWAMVHSMAPVPGVALAVTVSGCGAALGWGQLAGRPLLEWAGLLLRRFSRPRRGHWDLAETGNGVLLMADSDEPSPGVVDGGPSGLSGVPVEPQRGGEGGDEEPPWARWLRDTPASGRRGPRAPRPDSEAAGGQGDLPPRPAPTPSDDSLLLDELSRGPQAASPGPAPQRDVPRVDQPRPAPQAVGARISRDIAEDLPTGRSILGRLRRLVGGEADAPLPAPTALRDQPPIVEPAPPPPVEPRRRTVRPADEVDLPRRVPLVLLPSPPRREPAAPHPVTSQPGAEPDAFQDADDADGSDDRALSWHGTGAPASDARLRATADDDDTDTDTDDAMDDEGTTDGDTWAAPLSGTVAPRHALGIAPPAGAPDATAGRPSTAPIFVGAARRITFFSLNGGSGRTTLATELAGLLASRGRHRVAADLPDQPLKVALLDLDLRAATVAVRLGIPAPTLWDYLLQPDIDPRRLDDFMVSHSSGLRVLLGPSKPMGTAASPVDPARILEIINQLEREGLHFLVIDVSGDLDPVTMAVLSAVHDINVVITPTASGVQDAYRTTEALRRIGMGPKLAYVVNRARGAVDLDETMGDLGGHIIATIPYDPAVEAAENDHQLVACEGNGPAAEALRAFGAHVFPALGEHRPRRGLGRLWRSRVG